MSTRNLCLIFIILVNIVISTDSYVAQPILPPVKVGKKTYYIETFFWANWFNAYQFCTFHGMSLATILNENENNALVNALTPYVFARTRFWIAGTDLAEEGLYSWLTTGERFTYTNWQQGQPDALRDQNNRLFERCVELDNVDNIYKFKWNNIECTQEHPFICEAYNK